MTTALTLYPAATKTGTSRDLSTTQPSSSAVDFGEFPHSTAKYVLWDSTKYGDTTGTTALPAPAGLGCEWRVSTLSGKQLAAGTWTIKLDLKASVAITTPTLYCRVYLRTGSTYTLIGSVSGVLTGLTTSYATYTITGTLPASATFGATARLYLDFGAYRPTEPSAASDILLTLGATSKITTPGYTTPPPLGAAAKVIQAGHSTDDYTTRTSYTIALTGVGSTHPLLVYTVNGSATGASTSVTATGYTFKRVMSTHWATHGSGGPVTMDLWIGTGGSGGSVTVTVNYGVSTVCGGALFELNAHPTAVRTVSLTTPTVGKTSKSPTVTGTSNQLVMMFLCTQGYLGVNTYPSSPWTNYKYPVINTGVAGAVAYQNGNGSAMNCSWVGKTASGAWISCGVLIAGPTTPTPPSVATYTPRSGFPASNTQSHTLAITTTNVGDVVVLLANSQNTPIPTATVTDTNSRITWTTTPISVQKSKTADPSSSLIFKGVVTSVGATTITMHWSGTTPGNLQSLCVYEFGSTLGSSATWALVNAGAERRGTNQVVSVTGKVTYPALWSSASGGIYVGYTGLQTTPLVTTTKTSGFTYHTYSLHGTSGFISCYNAALAANTLYLPTTKQPQSTGGVVDANAVIIYAFKSGTTPPTETGSGDLTGSAAITGTPSVTDDGSGNLAGTGTLAGTSTIVESETGELAGAGTLTGTGEVVELEDGTLTGAAALTGTPSIVDEATAALAGAGTLTGSPEITEATDGSLDATGALTGAGAVIEVEDGSLTGAATLTGTGVEVEDGTGDLTATGALTGTAAIDETGTGALAAAGTLTGQGAITVPADGSLDAAAALTGTAEVTGSASGELEATAALAGTAEVTVDGTGALAGAGTLTGSPVVEVEGTGELDAAATLTGEATAGSVDVATGTLDGTGTLTGTSEVAVDGTGALDASGTLTGAAGITETESGALDGAAGLSGEAQVEVEADGSLDGTAALTGSGVAGSVTVGTGNLTGAGTLTGTPAVTVDGDGTLDGVGTLAGTSEIEVPADGALHGSATLTGSGLDVVDTSGALDGAGTLAGAGGIVEEAEAVLAAAATLTGTPTQTDHPDGALDATAVLTGTPALEVQATGLLDTSGTLTGRPSVLSPTVIPGIQLKVATGGSLTLAVVAGGVVALTTAAGGEVELKEAP